MNLRNALCTLLVLGLCLTLAAGQQSTATYADTPPSGTTGTAIPAVAVASQPADGRPNLRIFFTGRLLGYYRLPQWQDADFETVCPDEDSDNKKWRESLSLKDDEPGQTPAWQFLDFLNKEKKDKDGAVLSQKREEGDLLLGMGDNFGVTLESRAFRTRDSADKLWQLHPKSRNLDDKNWDSTNDDQIGDNVGCFFYQTGYDAIVPGKDDFYFGPERLRRIARRLAAAPSKTVTLQVKDSDGKDRPVTHDFHPVRMLGANLVLKTDYWLKPPDILDSEKNVKFAPGMPIGVKSLDASDNGILLPFTRQLRFQVSAHSIYSVQAGTMKPYLCQLGASSGEASDPDAFDPARCSRLDLISRGKEAKPAPDGAVYDFDLPQGWLPDANSFPGMFPQNYGLCVERDASDHSVTERHAGSKPYCIRLSLAEPLFRSIKPDAANSSEKVDEPPYVVKKVGDNTYAVVFGVVDPDLASLVGRDNLSWRNTASITRAASPPGKDYKTWVDVIDPAAALGVAMRNFDLTWKPSHPGAKVVRVLLAQMERGKAEVLAANLANTSVSDTPLNFDVVIASATKYSQATANQINTYERPPEIPDPEAKPEATTAGPKPPIPFRQFVMAPWQSYDEDNKRLVNPLRLLTLVDCPKGDCDHRTFKVAGDFKDKFYFPEPEKKEKLEPNYDGMGTTFLAGKRYWDEKVYERKYEAGLPRTNAGQPVSNAFAMAALAVLRDQTGADIAMLQERNFYWGPFPSTLNATSPTQPDGELLERILWMGDFEDVLTVKGSTLKKVLEESDKFDALDAQAANPYIETGRGLLTLGIEKTRDKDYLVSGTQLDPNRLYTVVTSNHIGAGDTGYPELADPQLADKYLPKPSVKPHPGHPGEDVLHPHIATAVCLGVGGSDCPADSGLEFAELKQHPPQAFPSTHERLMAWAKKSFDPTPDLAQDPNSFVDYQAQLRPTWRLSLKDFSLAFTSARNSLSEIDRSNELGGVSEPGAATQKGHSIDFSTHGELVKNTRRWDEFLRGLAEFKSVATASTTPLPLLTGQTLPTTVYALPVSSRSKNQWAVDAGVFLHGKHKYDSKFGALYEPFHFDMPLAPEQVPVDASYTATNTLMNPAFVFNLERKRDFFQRLAMRLESGKNSIEVGIQGGWEQNALSGLTSNLGPCPASAIEPLSTCLLLFQQNPSFQYQSLQQMNDTRPRSGVYGKIDWTLPISLRFHGYKFAFHTEDSGEFDNSFHGDNSTDTLFRNDAKESLKITVLPNLTFGPSLERFDYENKVNKVYLGTWSPGFNVTYSFDRFSGGDWRKSLSYSPSAAGSGSQ